MSQLPLLSQLASSAAVEIVRLGRFGHCISELNLNHLGHRNAFLSCPYYLSWLTA